MLRLVDNGELASKLEKILQHENINLDSRATALYSSLSICCMPTSPQTLSTKSIESTKMLPNSIACRSTSHHQSSNKQISGQCCVGAISLAVRANRGRRAMT
uniref:Uncharacterized protein n=1 Tax=Setaria viridis TaxID=4556 RepID=A0A4U6U6X3_SETVI|nr:hypothetical protein SEVIR_6G191100v2 [Setaria viridis]